jgi:hypothetical protein
VGDGERLFCLHVTFTRSGRNPSLDEPVMPRFLCLQAACRRGRGVIGCLVADKIQDTRIDGTDGRFSRRWRVESWT